MLTKTDSNSKENLAMTLGDLVAKYNKRRSETARPGFPQKAYDFVVTNIMDGTFKPATKLVERELASQLKISSVPVREAMEKLEQHGWIDRFPRRGAFVAEFNFPRVESSYQIREVIESGAVYIVTETVNEDQLEELKLVADILEFARETKNAEIFEEADVHFHKLIVHFAGNQRLERLFDSIILQAGAYFTLFWTSAMNVFMQTGHKADFVDPMSHTAICDAIAERNLPLAEDLIRTHIRHSFSVISKMMEFKRGFVK